MNVIASLDQGTQSTRVFIYDENAAPIASHHVEFKQHRQKAGYALECCPDVTTWYNQHCHCVCSWIEHDPEEIWQGVQTCVQGAVAAAQKKVGNITVKALGITNQRETTLVWDKATGRALCKAIVWMDTRTQQICTDMTDELGSKAGLMHELSSTCAWHSSFAHFNTACRITSGL